MAVHLHAVVTHDLVSHKSRDDGGGSGDGRGDNDTARDSGSVYDQSRTSSSNWRAARAACV